MVFMGYMMDRYLSQLAIELDLSEPSKDRTQINLILNPTLTITLKELDPGLLFFSLLNPLPTTKKEAIFQFAMQANFLGQGTGGAVLGIDEDEKFLTLSLDLPYDMNYQEFRNALSDFANYVDYWKEQIKRKELE